jgi:two-component system, chemotaxis family, CheB/CheR fusion protein
MMAQHGPTMDGKDPAAPEILFPPLAIEERDMTINLILEGSHIGAWEWIVAGGSVTTRRHWGETFGVDHIANGIVYNILHPEDVESTRQAVALYFAGRGGERAQFEFRVKDDAGGWRSILARARTVAVDDAGRPRHIVGIHVDITEQRKMLTALRESEERYRAVVEGATDAIIVINEEGVFRFLNSEAAMRTGLRAQDIVGKTMHDIFPPDIATPQLANIRQVIRTGRGSVKNSITVLRGEARVYHTSLQPLTLASGERAALLVARDITDRQRAEHELSGLNAQLTSRANQLRALASELTRAEQRERQRVSEVLHDHVQQTLAAAKLRLGMLRGSMDEPESQALLGQVRELLTASIAAVRTLAVELSPPVLKEGTLSAALEWLSDEFWRRHHLRVRVLVESGCDVPVGDLRVAVFQAVRELLFNVTKYAGVETAEVTARAEGDVLQLRVADTGAGFRPAEASSSRGLGLFSIRERLEALGGGLEVESEPGAGTRVLLSLPIGHQL